MTIQKALAEALEKYGHKDIHGRPRNQASIAIHRINEYELDSANTLASLTGEDRTSVIKYAVRKVDQVINLHIWKQEA